MAFTFSILLLSFLFSSLEKKGKTTHVPYGSSISLQPGAAERRARHGARVVEPVRDVVEEEEREKGWESKVFRARAPIKSIAHERIIIPLSLHLSLYFLSFSVLLVPNRYDDNGG